MIYIYRDAPNAWPPHQYIILQALRNLPANVSTGPIRLPNAPLSTYSLIPAGQLGLNESQLPGQPIRSNSETRNASAKGSSADINSLNGTVINGGAFDTRENWTQVLQRELANRYFTSVICSW
jgi:alpha,alpha-trehalase